MFERFARSLDLASASWKVLMDDKSLLLFPILSGASLVMVLASFLIPALAMYPSLAGLVAAIEDPTPSSLAGIFAFYLANYFVIAFFNTALVSVALARFDGDTIPASEGLRTAAANLPAILFYSIVSACIGTALRWMEKRVSMVGVIVVSLIGVAWTAVSYMFVPVLAAESRGPFDALERSARLIRKNWGESLIGNAGIGLVSGFVGFVVLMVGVGMIAAGAHSGQPGLVHMAVFLTAGALGVVAVLTTALHAVYSAALYRYAIGARSGPFDSGLLVEAFQAR
jgi:hypothetical protein